MITVETFGSASAASSALDHRSKYFGGGTLIMRDINYGDQSFDRIIRSNDPALRRIDIQQSSVVIGAGVTMSNIISHRGLAFLRPVARAVGGPAIRNMATIGGNLFAPSPFGDFATALLALDAEIQYAAGNSEKIERFFSSRTQAPKQIVVSVQFKIPERNTFRFKKVTRIKPKGVSIMSIAVILPRRAGRVRNARIAFGAMGETPLRAKEAESALEFSTLDQASIASAAELATAQLLPQDDALASAWYRNKVASIRLQRLLKER